MLRKWSGNKWSQSFTCVLSYIALNWNKEQRINMKPGWPDVPQLHHLQSEFCAHYWSGKGCKSHWSIIGVGNVGGGCPGYIYTWTPSSGYSRSRNSKIGQLLRK